MNTILVDLVHAPFDTWLGKCSKFCHTKLEAKKQLAKITKQRKRKLKHAKHRKECAYYFCVKCNAYHLTSQKR